MSIRNQIYWQHIRCMGSCVLIFLASNEERANPSQQRMNEMKRTLLALATTLSLTTAALLGSSPAFASDYSGNCAGIGSFDGTGNVDITDTSCSLPQSITATGFIHISADSVSGSGMNLTAGADVSVTASGGDITVGTVTSGSTDNIIISGTADVTSSTLTSASNIQITTTGGAISTGDITSRTAGGSALGNVLLTASGNVGTGDIDTNGAAQAADVEIDANTGGTSTAFNVGGGGANGSGTINASVTSGGAQVLHSGS
jgi:hypothetical protein